MREVLRGAARRPCDPPEGVAAAVRSVLVLTHSRLKNRHAGDEEEPEFQQAEFQRLLDRVRFPGIEAAFNSALAKLTSSRSTLRYLIYH